MIIENLKFLRQVSLSFLHLTFPRPRQCFSPIGTLKRSGFGIPSSTEPSREPSAGSGACVTVAPRMTTATPPERPPGLADGSPVLFFPSATPSSQSPRLKNWGLFSSLFSFPTSTSFCFWTFYETGFATFPRFYQNLLSAFLTFPMYHCESLHAKRDISGLETKRHFYFFNYTFI